MPMPTFVATDPRGRERIIHGAGTAVMLRNAGHTVEPHTVEPEAPEAVEVPEPEAPEAPEVVEVPVETEASAPAHTREALEVHTVPGLRKIARGEFQIKGARVMNRQSLIDAILEAQEGQ